MYKYNKFIIFFILLTTACGPTPFPGSPQSEGLRDVPFVATNAFNFKTSIFPIVSPQGNLPIISGADLLNLLAAANVTQLKASGVVTGVVMTRGEFPVKDVKVEATDSAGNTVGDLFFNNLGGIPDFSNSEGTSDTGSFTILNVPPGEVFIKATRGGRGNIHILSFTDEISMTKIQVVPVVVASIGITGPINEIDAITEVENVDLFILGEKGKKTTAGRRGFYRMSLGSDSNFILKMIKKEDHLDTFHELSTDLSQLGDTGALDLTAYLTMVSNKDVDNLANQAGITLDRTKGIIWGTLKQPDSTPVTNGTIIVTDSEGNNLGEGNLFYISGLSIHKELHATTIGMFIVFNMPEGEVFLKATSEIATSGVAQRRAGTSIINIFPGKAHIDNIVMKEISPDPSFPSLVSYTQGIIGTILNVKKNKITGIETIIRVTDVNVKVLGLAGLSELSDINGDYIIQPGEINATSPILKLSKYILKFSKKGFIDTYLQINNTGLIEGATRADVTIFSQDELDNLTTAAEVNILPDRGIVTGTILDNKNKRATEGISIELTDLDGNPIGDIRYFNEEGLPSKELKSSTSNGQYIIFNLPPGLAFVNVTSIDDSGNSVIRSYANGIISIDLGVNNAPPPTIDVSGSVKDLDKSKVSNASISLQGTTVSFLSDANGNYSQTLDSDNKNIAKVTKENYYNTYNYDFDTLGINEGNKDLVIYSRENISGIASEGEINIDNTKGIIAGETTFDSFKLSNNYETDSPIVVKIGFFDSDDNIDLAVLNENKNTISIYFGRSDGTFRFSQKYTVGRRPNDIAVGDFNKDGFQDLAVIAAGDNLLGIFIGSKDGTFSIRSNKYSTGNNPSNIIAEDIDSDKIIDLIISNKDSNSIQVFKGNGNGTFSELFTSETGIGPKGLAIADFNGDKLVDIAIANSESDYNPTTGLTVEGVGILFQGANDVFFLPAGKKPVALARADFNADGNMDIAVVNEDSDDVYVLLIKFKGSALNLTIIPIPVGNKPTSITVGEFNGDGRFDLAVTDSGSNDLTILLGNGDGSFGNSITFTTGKFPTSISTADFNNDGKLDLVVTNFLSGTISVYNNSEIILQGVSVEARNMDGKKIGDVRYIDNNGNLSGDFTSDTGQFIIFNVPAGYTMIKATEGGSGNKYVSSYINSLSFTKLKVGTLPPFDLNVSGRIGDSVGRPIGETRVNFLGTGIETISKPGPSTVTTARSDTAKYEVTLDSYSEYIVRITK